MLSLKSLLNPLALSLTMILSTHVWAKPQHHPDGGLHQILKQLDLNEQQRQDIRQLLKQNRADKSLYREDVKNHDQELRSLIQSETWDQAEVKAALKETREANSDHMWQKVQRTHQIWLALTPTQQQQFLQWLAQQDDKKDDLRHVHKRLENLNLTEQQWAQVADNRGKMTAYLTEHKAAQQTFRQSLSELIGAQELSHHDWQILQNTHQQEWLAHAMFKAQNAQTQWTSLTPEQQNKWQLMHERAELKMHKHKPQKQ